MQSKHSINVINNNAEKRASKGIMFPSYQPNTVQNKPDLDRKDWIWILLLAGKFSNALLHFS